LERLGNKKLIGKTEKTYGWDFNATGKVNSNSYVNITTVS